MSFTPNPQGIKELGRTGEMRAFMAGVGAAAVSEVESRKPALRGGKAIKVSHVEQVGSDGVETEVRADGSFWHLPEFGGVHWPARPYLRSGVQAALSRFDGRFRGD